MEKNLEMKEIESAMEGFSSPPVSRWRSTGSVWRSILTAPRRELVLQKLSDYYAYERRGIRLVRMEEELPALLRAGVCRRHPPGL